MSFIGYDHSCDTNPLEVIFIGNKKDKMKQSFNEQIGRIKTMMNLNEDDSQMVMLQQSAEEFNEKAEEDLTTDEFQEIVCTNPDSVEVPSDVTPEQKQKFEEFKLKAKTASIDELKQVKRQLKELRKQKKQQDEQIAGPTVITLLGVSMPPAFAMVIGGIMLIIVLNFLLRLFNIRMVRTITSWCTGRQSTGYGVRFGRN